jgi:hypothetical protein
MTAMLPPLGDEGGLERTRRSWHAVAEHVLAAARYDAEQRIGLVVAPSGFGTPVYGGGRSARVAGEQLVVSDPTGDRTTRLTTLADAAAAVGVTPGAPPVYTAVTPLALDAQLTIDAESARVLAAWFELGWGVLHELDADVTLWPEHFDVACEVGDEARGQRGTFGASPGDDEHPEPYLYVTHWVEVPDDEYWNDRAFGGASAGYRSIAGTTDPRAAARAFFEHGRRLLLRQR